MRIDFKDLKLIRQKLHPFFKLLENKRIFVTGGTGFFGKWILEAIIHLNSEMGDGGIQLTVLSRDPEYFKIVYPHLCQTSYIKFVKGDVRYFDVEGKLFDYIIHAATDASSTLNRENPNLMRSTIIDGAKRICEFSKKVQCGRVLYTSSGAAYGPQPIDMDGLREDFIDNQNFNCNDTYASSKLESEIYLKQNLQCELVIARCFAFVGPYLPTGGSFAIGNFIKNAIEGDDITITGDGNSIRSYLYAADLVIWLITILFRGTDREIYNVGSNDAIYIKSLATKVANLKALNTITLNKKNELSNYYYPNIEKAKALGLDIYTPLDTSIKKTFEYLT